MSPAPQDWGVWKGNEMTRPAATVRAVEAAERGPGGTANRSASGEGVADGHATVARPSHGGSGACGPGHLARRTPRNHCYECVRLGLDTGDQLDRLVDWWGTS